jgi:hypothetical protein
MQMGLLRCNKLMNAMSRILFPALLLFIISGCDLGAGSAEVSGSFARWTSHNIHNYSIDQERQCFCPDRGPVRIVVQSDRIVSVVQLSDSLEIPSPDRERYLTVDSLFAITFDHGTDSVVTAFDSIYGYPTLLDINPQLHPVDGGVLYRTYNLTIR